MAEELLINVMPGEIRAAMLDEGALAELFIEREGRASLVGNIYLGRVERVLPGMEAAFVDLGIGRAGFLSVDAARDHADSGERIGDIVTEGQAITVQVVKDAIGRKGCQLATRITLPGRHLVYTPTQSRIAVSRQIDDEEEQERLRGLMNDIAGSGEGFILRTAAVGAEREDLERDAEYLRTLWIDIEATRDQASAPALLHGELDPLLRFFRDNVHAGLSGIHIDHPGSVTEARQFCAKFMPAVEPLIEHYQESEPIYAKHDLEGEIEDALAPRFALPSGGSIVIEPTEALTSVDVNSGSFTSGSHLEDTALKTNLEAADEIARQIRLRNIGGLIVIDFIHMEEDDNWEDVMDALEDGLAGDRTPSRVLGLSEAGLVEVTRRRRRPSLSQLLMEPCATCHGTGHRNSAETVGQSVMRALRREARVAAPGPLAVHARTEVIDALDDALREPYERLLQTLGRTVELRGEAGYDRDQFDIVVAEAGAAQ